MVETAGLVMVDRGVGITSTELFGAAAEMAGEFGWRTVVDGSPQVARERELRAHRRGNNHAACCDPRIGGRPPSGPLVPAATPLNDDRAETTSDRRGIGLSLLLGSQL